MPDMHAKAKELSMVQQSIIDARNAPALTSEILPRLTRLRQVSFRGAEVAVAADMPTLSKKVPSLLVANS